MSGTAAEVNGRIVRNNHAVARCAGVLLTVDRMVRPDDSRRSWSVVSIAMLVVLAVCLVKIALPVAMGEDAFAAALADLKTGAALDRAAAYLLQIDRATRAILDIVL